MLFDGNGEPPAAPTPTEAEEDALALQEEEEAPEAPKAPTPLPVTVEVLVPTPSTGEGAGAAGAGGAGVEEAPTPPARARVLSEDEVNAGVAVDATFLLTSDRALVDLRLRLFDERGRIVPAEEEATVGVGTRYTLRPADPLQPGALYRLAAEGQEGKQPADVSGEVYLPASFSIRTADDTE